MGAGPRTFCCKEVGSAVFEIRPPGASGTGVAMLAGAAIPISRLVVSSRRRCRLRLLLVMLAGSVMISV